MTLPPCKDCDTRYVACHATCEKYIEWKKVYETEKKAIDENRREADRNFNSMTKYTLRKLWRQRYNDLGRKKNGRWT